MSFAAERARRFMRADARCFVKPGSFSANEAGRQHELATLRFNLKLLGKALNDVVSRAHDVARKYNSDQPRVPAGQTGGGQWTDGSGGASLPEKPVRLAGDIPTKDPEVPRERPSSAKERNRIARALARLLRGRIGPIVEAASWLIEYVPEISSYFDPPKSLEELQQAASTPAPGYDIHHIVERSAAARDGFPTPDIDVSDNLVRIPRWKHW
ncbi:MAG: hypothetical protein EPO23_00435 [Xanthobacteraceae bacterium]|nr:MAG: hypothetical protein EPO23_00435 [Xanthobacteraceae bacterium]